MKKSEAFVLAIALVLIISTGIAKCVNDHKRAGRELMIPHIKGMVELGRLADTSKTLIAGYNCYILKKFATDNGRTAEIRLVPRGESYIDSLKNGAIDVLVLPFTDSSLIENSDMLISVPLDSLSIWYTGRNDSKWIKEINEWIAEWHKSEDYLQARDIYLDNYSPFRRKEKIVDRLSPYDDIMKSCADSNGIDWRFLCAVAYKESRFHIEAYSFRGASGLMQLMPSTGQMLGATDLVDPEQSIAAAARHFSELGKRYCERRGKEESMKFSLAAYNAGPGRIADCIRYAEYRGVDSRYWDNIVGIIPEMNDSTNIAACGVVKCGTFKGVETIAYVNAVMGIYSRFKQMCPDK